MHTTPIILYDITESHSNGYPALHIIKCNFDMVSQVCVNISLLFSYLFRLPFSLSQSRSFVFCVHLFERINSNQIMLCDNNVLVQVATYIGMIERSITNSFTVCLILWMKFLSISSLYHPVYLYGLFCCFRWP